MFFRTSYADGRVKSLKSSFLCFLLLCILFDANPFFRDNFLKIKKFWKLEVSIFVLILLWSRIGVCVLMYALLTGWLGFHSYQNLRAKNRIRTGEWWIFKDKMFLWTCNFRELKRNKRTCFFNLQLCFIKLQEVT